jgi:hypothetical protein
MMNVKRFAVNLMLVFTLLLCAGVAHVYGSTINVPVGNSIQAAIDAASPGDTIQLSSGTYTENIVINKRIILQGNGPTNTIIASASPGVSVVTITAGGDDAVNRLIVKDLRITGANGGDNSAGSGIYYASGPLGFTTFDNISSDNNSGNGISIESQNPLNDILIQNSNLTHNSNAGLRAAAVCPSINALKILNSHLDFNSAGMSVFSHIVTNWEIRNSTFNDNSGPAGTAFTGGYGIGFDGIDNLNNINIACSEFSRNKGNSGGGDISSGIFLLSVEKPSVNVSYTNVTITNSLFDSNALNGILLQAGDNTVMDAISLSCNTIKSSDTGVLVSFFGTPTGISIQHSNIFNNSYAGVDNQNASPIDARFNWWGNASGPSGIGPGTGDAIYGAVTFNPFRTTASACPSSCTPAPAISIIKKTNGTDNDVAPGLYIPVGSTVTWTYIVTNTGNVPLTNVTVTDDKIGAITCPTTTLGDGESMTCSASSIAVAGQYTNIGTATGTPPTGPNVTASNPDNYFGSAPAISIIKKTNGTDNNSAPGPTIPVGSTVTWTYIVTNTGNVPLTNVAVTDDKIGAITCPATTLAAGATMTCTKTGTAVAGQYTNIGTATGTPPTGPNVTASNPDNYFGSAPAISIIKKTNGTNNDVAPGPTVLVGSTVTWTYIVTNTGNVPLTYVTVTDNKIGTIACPQTSLAVGASMTCTKTGTAIAGQYTNIGTATGKPPVGSNVTASNPDNYFGVVPCTGKIGDFVWNDLNANGIQDKGEPGISSVTVQLKNSSGTVIQTTTTNSYGYYQFTAVCAGTYKVVVTTPAGYSPTPSLVGSNRAIDSNGSPATVTLATSSSTDLTIDFGFVKFATGYTTYTQGGWGTAPSGMNPGWLLSTYFLKVYKIGYVQIGGTKYLKFTSVKAIQIFLPNGTTPGILTASATNPTTSSAGVFASQILALRLNVDFSTAGIKKSGLGNLKIISGPLAGYTVNQVLTLANTVLGGNTGALPAGISLSTLSNVLDTINNNFDSGTTNNGYLK